MCEAGRLQTVRFRAPRRHNGHSEGGRDGNPLRIHAATEQHCAGGWIVAVRSSCNPQGHAPLRCSHLYRGTSYPMRFPLFALGMR